MRTNTNWQTHIVKTKTGRKSITRQKHIGEIQVGEYKSKKYWTIPIGKTTRKTTIPNIQFGKYKSEKYTSGNTNRKNTNQTNTYRKIQIGHIQIGKYKL